MGMTGLFFLSSGLFLGWSLGANDASNVYGTAVASRMVKFKTAALLCSIFLMLGALIDGVGTAHTLGSLGSVNAIGGAFVTSFAAAFTVFLMTKYGLPVSVSQAVVGAIIGWNWFTDSITDVSSVVKIASTWIACPILGGIFGALVFAVFKQISKRVSLSLLQRDALTRFAMIVTGAFGSYALGANNMANVVGVFIPVVPFTEFSFFGLEISPVHQLFFVGALAVAVGVYTYSYKVMMTVGKGLLPLSPFAAWVVVLSQSVVLFIFASEGLEYFLASHGLPTIPLVPVSSTQAVVGAVIGIGIYKGAARNIDWTVFIRIMCGWIITPVITALVCFISLYVMKNLFDQPVYTPKAYVISDGVLTEFEEHGILAPSLKELIGKSYSSGKEIVSAVEDHIDLTNKQELIVLKYAEVVKIKIDPAKIVHLSDKIFSEQEKTDLSALANEVFHYRWELENALVQQNKAWQKKPDTVLNKKINNEIMQQYKMIEGVFKWEAQG